MSFISRLGRSLSVALFVWYAMPAAVHAQTAQTAQPPAPLKPPPEKPDLAKLPKTPIVPTTFEGLFAERDSRAQDALAYLRCMQSTINALRTGALGQVPTEWSITCIRQGTEWRGVFGALTEKGISVRLQYALRGTAGTITRDRVDTARVNGTARALLRGLSAPLPGGGKYEIVPIPIALDKFIEVWFLPVPTKPTNVVVGGDSLIQMSSDGVRELGHIKQATPIRTLQVPLDGATWTLPSLEERLPAVSELMLAHMALDVLPEVRVRTNQYDSVIKRGQTTWTHIRR